jgi:predicted enzyme related to lactoylglutathione lyase
MEEQSTNNLKGAHEMNTQIYVNLPVKDLDRSMAFFTAVGFKNNPRFTDKTAACMAVTDEINAMLPSALAKNDPPVLTRS